MQHQEATTRRILCVGMCVLDIVHVCEEFPAEDTDKRCLDGYWQRGGNASNNCTVLRKLGADQCEFLGMLSHSPAFGFLVDDCQRRGILIENCPHVEQDPPFSSVILVKASDTRTIIHSNPNFPILTYEHFRSIDLSQYRWIHFEARNPDETLFMLRHICSFNAKHKPKERIQISVELEKVRVENLVLAEFADYVFLGKDLAQHLEWTDARDAVFGLREILREPRERRPHKPSIICTWGAQGSSCLDGDNNYEHLEAMPPPQVVDSLGAGDTFCAATIYALSEMNLELQEAVAFGNRCAGYKLGHRGYDAIAEWTKQ